MIVLQLPVYIIINSQRCVSKKHYGKATAYTVYVNFRYEYANPREMCSANYHIELPIYSILFNKSAFFE